MLRVEIEGEDIVIRLSPDALIAATQGSPATEHYLDGDDDTEGHFANVEVTNIAEWRNAVIWELHRESEDGTTLVHEMFDRAFERAIEGGAEGIKISGLTE